jgi:pimeloyl-ACP methyl ester carboxylesterase
MSVSSRSVSSDPVGDQGEFVVHDRRVVVDGVQLQYLEAGSGPALLLLHGHEQSATSWRWVTPVLARTHRVLAPLVVDFLDTIGVGPLHLVGNSVGGAVALRLALADPARIRTLTLVDSAGLGRDVHPLLALDTLPRIGELAIMMSRLPGGGLGRTTMSTAMLFAQPTRVPQEFFTEQHALGRRPGQLEASTAMARALFDANGQREVLLDRLAELTMPTLVVWGGLRLRAARLPGPGRGGPAAHGRLALFADRGHLPHVECPDRFATVLSQWLAEHHDSS